MNISREQDRLAAADDAKKDEKIDTTMMGGPAVCVR